MKVYIFSQTDSFDDQTIAFSNKRDAIKHFNYRAEFRDKEFETSTTIRHGYGENDQVHELIQPLFLYESIFQVMYQKILFFLIYQNL